MKEEIRTDAASAPMGPYSQGMRVGNLVFTAGMGPLDPETGKVVGDTIEEQTELTIDNLSAVLEEAGSGLDHAVKATSICRTSATSQPSTGSTSDASAIPSRSAPPWAATSSASWSRSTW